MFRFISIFCLGLFVVSALPSARAQIDAAEMGFSQLQTTVNDMIGRGELAEAYPYLAELLDRFEHAEGVSLEMPRFFAGQAKLALYQRTGDVGHLRDAEAIFQRFRTDYPNSDQMPTVLQRLGALYAEMQRYQESIDVLAVLLRPPYERHLSYPQRIAALAMMTRLHYLLNRFEEGVPYFSMLLNETRDPSEKALAAAALFEGYMESGKMDEALTLLPVLALETEVRYRPRLNVAYFKASDVFANSARYTDAALVLSLALTTREMLEYFINTRTSLESQIAWLSSLNPSNPRIAEMNTEIARIDGNLKQMEELPPLEEDLLVRKARNYAQTHRTYEAFWLFYRLMEENSDSEQVEFFTYAVFANARELHKDDVAVEIGERYMERYPEGQYIEDTMLSMAFLYRDLERWEEFEALAMRFLKAYPGNDNGEALLLSYGRHLIDVKEYERLQNDMNELLRIHPNALYADGALYWGGMAYLQERKYDEALERFLRITKEFPHSIYAAESLFRTGVIYFAQMKYTESRATLLLFQEKYPDDHNLDQSFYFLAQIAKVEGDFAEAERCYREAIRISKAQDMQNILHFELADLLMSSGRFEEAIALLEGYLNEFGENADMPTASLLIGRSAEALRRPSMMLNIYRKAIADTITLPVNPGMEEILLSYGKKIGENRKLFGKTLEFFTQMENDRDFLTNMVTDRGVLFEYFYENPDVDQELYQKFRREPGLGTALLKDLKPLQDLKAAYQSEMDILMKEDGIAFLTELLAQARERGDYVGEVRLNMGLAALDAAEPLSRELAEEDFQTLSPLTLMYVGNRLQKEGNLEFARRSWQEILNRFPHSDSAVDANKALALDAEAHGDNELALVYFKTINDQFADSDEAPEAILSRGRVLTKLGRYDEARLLYAQILSIPEWRGELYARAIYGSGKTYEAEGKLPEAHGFMERVFVAYPQFGEWAGNAYLDDARILLSMGHPQDARKTLQEAISIGGQSIPPETMKEIRDLLGTIP